MTTSRRELINEARFDNGRRIAVLMMSGGIDSTTMAYRLLDDGNFDQYHAVFINLGVESAGQEYNSVNRTCAALGLRFIEADFSWYRTAFGGIVPAFEKDPLDIHPMLSEQSRKSAAGATSVAVYAETIGSFDMFHGVNKGDLERYEFMPPVFEHIEAMMTLGNARQFTVHTPWIDAAPEEVLSVAVDNDVPLENTWSCWVGRGIHCGVCGGCISRKKKFQALKNSRPDLKDPVRYES